ncbi:hypothetical protein BPIT_18150 [Candidatus Brocadia pituitae]|nr:hypothetical protein BPIT_18150 [Candidatus Brocadia pituitae]
MVRSLDKIPHLQDSENPQYTECPDDDEIFCPSKKITEIQGKNGQEIDHAHEAEKIFQGFLYASDPECKFNTEKDRYGPFSI